MNRYYFFAIVAAIVLASSLQAQIPRQISYQGSIIVNADDKPLTGTHDLTIRLYDAETGGVQIYEETYTGVPIEDGLFSIILGANSSLPTSIDFSKQYFLGVAIDGGTELIPRTRLTSSPYALRADVANSLAAGANVVTSVNTIKGAVKIVGGGGTTVTRTSDTIVVSSTGGGGTGIQGVQNSDGNLSITNPNGPVATINLQSVPLSMLSASGASFDQVLKFNGSMWEPSWYTVSASARFTGNGTAGSPIELASQGASSGQVLKWTGTAWAPGSDNLGVFTLPFSSNVSSSNTLFSATNTGSGRAGEFIINNTTSASTALYVTSNGSGSAGDFFKDVAAPNPVLFTRAGTNTTSGAFAARNDGTGVTATIRNYNTSNSSNVLEVSTAGTGKAGYFQINNNASSAYALEVTSNSAAHSVYSTASTPNASAVYGFHGGTGTGITGSSNDGLGVYGVSVSGIGVRGLHNVATGTSAGVEGKTLSVTAGTTAFLAGATGVYGEVTPTSPGAWTVGVRGHNKGTAANGVGVIGVQDGTGYGVYGESAGAGTGVYGKSTAAGFGGYFDVPGGGAGWGVVASTAAKPGGGVWAVFSDRNLKRDIRPFTDGLDILERIDPVWYTYTGKGGMPAGESFVGIVAQDMQPLMPYAVQESRGLDRATDERYLSFDGSALTYIQINAIKELSTKLEAMYLRIQALEEALRDKGIDPETITK